MVDSKYLILTIAIDLLHVTHDMEQWKMSRKPFKKIILYIFLTFLLRVFSDKTCAHFLFWTHFSRNNWWQGSKKQLKTHKNYCIYTLYP